MSKPKWLEVAEKEIGIHEVAGEENNPRIIEYDATTTLHADKDEVPWCSSFVNWCLSQVRIIGTNSALAKSWLSWGVPVDKPELGCICIIRQKQQGEDQATGSSTGYHVAFWLGEFDGKVGLLGGNQSDSVKISHFNLRSYTIEGYRMPKEGGEV